MWQASRLDYAAMTPLRDDGRTIHASGRPDRGQEAGHGLDPQTVRAEFLALDQTVHGHPLVYLDNAATALKPRCVIEAVTRMYARDCANVHRGVHMLSQRATDAYEQARESVGSFINAESAAEVVFVRGTTEAINLVAQAWAIEHIGPGDQILITGLEHHANIVPWQMVCKQVGAELVAAPVDDTGAVPLAEIQARISKRTRLVAIAHVSNVLGTVLPVRAIADLAHASGALVLVDGAQAVPHMAVDVRALGCDFYTFSGHKLYGPTGIGVLWARRDILASMSLYQGGGGMIQSVTLDRTLYRDEPYRFEAGTPHIAGAVGLRAAIEYVGTIGFEAISAHERDLLAYATARLGEVAGLRLIGTAGDKTGVLSFTIESVHPHDIGTVVDTRGVAIRTGHHCAQPLMERFAVPAMARASLALYNTRSDIDALIDALLVVEEMFG